MNPKLMLTVPISSGSNRNLYLLLHISLHKDSTEVEGNKGRVRLWGVENRRRGYRQEKKKDKMREEEI
jgi:hypothetical protein